MCFLAYWRLDLEPLTGTGRGQQEMGGAALPDRANGDMCTEMHRFDWGYTVPKEHTKGRTKGEAAQSSAGWLESMSPTGGVCEPKCWDPQLSHRRDPMLA